MKTFQFSKLSVLIISLFAVSALKAQNEDDALRYSRTMIGGTARNMAMGGSFGALGGDFSTLSSNPAGIGMYRRSEFMLSPQLHFGSTQSNYLGTQATDDRFALNFQNWGLVFSYPGEGAKSESDGWRRFSFGIGYNRIADFNNRVQVTGQTSSLSQLDVYQGRANGLDPSRFDAFGANLAYQTYLINPIFDTTGALRYSTEMPFGTPKVQSKSIETRGGIGETVLSFGLNWSDKLFIGWTVGFTRVRYFEETVYGEKDIDNTVPLDFYELSSDLTTEGSGTNLKIGLIYAPVDFIRLGASVHTPTFYRLNDSFQSTMIAKFDSLPTVLSFDSPIGNYNYRLRTPLRALGSVGFIIGKYGLISGDYELVDYRNARLRADDYAFAAENAAVRNKYRAAGNLRVGGELRLAPISLRAGYAMNGSPFKNTNLQGSFNNYTAGIGFRESSFYIDFAVVFWQKRAIDVHLRLRF
jgi:hypothetical protein